MNAFIGQQTALISQHQAARFITACDQLCESFWSQQFRLMLWRNWSMEHGERDACIADPRFMCPMKE
jgi:hypothetical protein